MGDSVSIGASEDGCQAINSCWLICTNIQTNEHSRIFRLQRDNINGRSFVAIMISRFQVASRSSTAVSGFYTNSLKYRELVSDLGYQIDLWNSLPFQECQLPCPLIFLCYRLLALISSKRSDRVHAQHMSYPGSLVYHHLAICHVKRPKGYPRCVTSP